MNEKTNNTAHISVVINEKQGEVMTPARAEQLQHNLAVGVALSMLDEGLIKIESVRVADGHIVWRASADVIKPEVK